MLGTVHHCMHNRTCSSAARIRSEQIACTRSLSCSAPKSISSSACSDIFASTVPVICCCCSGCHGMLEGRGPFTQICQPVVHETACRGMTPDSLLINLKVGMLFEALFASRPSEGSSSNQKMGSLCRKTKHCSARHESNQQTQRQNLHIRPSLEFTKRATLCQTNAHLLRCKGCDHGVRMVVVA